MRAAIFAALALAAGCAPPHREVQVVPSLQACLPSSLNALQVSALGDFPPDPTGVVSIAPSGPPATLRLPDGTRVIAALGLGPEGPVAFGRTAPLDPALVGGTVPIAFGAPDGICATSAMVRARSGHRAALLSDGSVVLTGGLDDQGSPVLSLERYLPTGDLTNPPGSFVAVDPGGSTALDVRAAIGHALAVLPGGDFYVVGGAPVVAGRADGIAYGGMTHHTSDGTIDGPPRVLDGDPRAFHTATVLADGRVLIAGGCKEPSAGDCPTDKVLSSTEIFDPVLLTFTAGPDLAFARWDHDAILRGDGSVLMVGGGVGLPGSSAPIEVFDPDEPRAITSGAGSGRAALLPTGTVVIAGGARDAAAAGVTLWLSPMEQAVTVGALPQAVTGETVTALEDGATLVAGGATSGGLFVGPAIVDARGGAVPLTANFSRRDHTATRLTDGTVLLAGGVDESGGASNSAFIYLRSPLGPYSSLPALALGDPAAPVEPRRPDRAGDDADVLALQAPSTAGDGRPQEWALVSALQLQDFTLAFTAASSGTAAAAVVFGWTSDASYAFLTLEAGRPVTLSTVTLARTGQSAVVPDAGCVGAALDAGEFPDGAPLPLTLSFVGGVVDVASPARPLLHCAPQAAIGRGAVGVGAIQGTARFGTATITR